MAFADVYNLNPRPYWGQFLYTGQMYTASHQYNITASSTVYMQTYVPNDTIVHLIQRSIMVNSGGPISVRLYENPTFTTGTASPNCVTNLDRRSTKTPNFVLYTNPSSVSGGTLLSLDIVPTGGGTTGTGQLVSGIAELVLKPETNYVLNLTNLGGSSSITVLNYLWYESSN